MPRTRRVYGATCATVDCATALSRTILVGLLVSVVLTFMLVPSVSAQHPTFEDFLALRGAIPDSDDQEESVEAHARQLLVRFERNTSRAQAQMIHDRAGAIELKRYRLVEGLRLVEVAEGQLGAVMKKYADEQQVVYAQPDYVIHTAAIPDDPGFPLQWGLRNTGQTVVNWLGQDDPGTPGADIYAEEAWNLTTGDAAFRIAILDTGVDYNHPDLAANIWTNPGETGLDGNGNPKETNGIDDDGNGWIDDVHGYDTVNDDGDPMDDHSHGTHVAGIIGAVGNNGLGVTGVNWQCQIVALKFIRSDGLGLTSDAIEAMDYLIDNGILLSNNSWGNAAPFNPAMSDAVSELQSIGHLFVAAAGNFYGRNIDEIPFYPASFDFPHLIAVASVNNDDILSLFSNIGPLTVDLAAPGDGVWSTLPGGSYGFSAGTSMAAPHVTGTAALLWGLRPELSWSEVRTRLLRSVRTVPSLIGRTVTGGVIDASVAVGDCNHNGVPDEEDIAQGGSVDCNSDGFPDECEPDCNGNDVADACDIATGTSQDCNGNAVPDECELATGSSEDCNGNDVPDECDLVSGDSEDLNATGVPDECETCTVVTDCDDANACTEDSCTDGLCFWIDHTEPCDDGDACTMGDACQSGVCVGTSAPDSECLPVLSMEAVAINGNAISGGPLSEVTVTRGDLLTIDMFARNWTPQEVAIYQVTIDPSGYTSGTTGSLAPLVEPTPDAGAFIDKARPDFMFFGRTAITNVANLDPSFYSFAGLVNFDENCAVDAGGSAYLGTLVLDIGETAVGRFQMCLDEDFDFSFLMDCANFANPDRIAPILFECLTILAPPDDCTPGADCNANGSWDICDITDGTSEDCNGNNIPDECDVDSGFSEDCNGNAVPDECDLAGGSSDDCDGNGLPDECDIDSGFSDDCNGNGVPDECDETFAPAVNYAAGDEPRSVAIGDLNGDQVPDLAVANIESNTVSVLMGIGDGTFVTRVDYAAGYDPISVAIADLDGDQVPDLAVANEVSDNVSVLLGVGDGTFADAMNYAAGDRPVSLAIGDLDGDQVPDLAVANQWSDNVSVLLGLGEGTFAEAMNYAAGNSPRSVAIGDLDGDLVPDLAVANFASDTVSVLPGFGDGTFAAAVHYDAGSYPISVAIGDLNGDQLPDLAVVNSQNDFVSVLLGTGAGTFAAAVHYDAGRYTVSVVIGDLDADHVPDLAVVNQQSWTVSVLRGFGDGTFAAAFHYAAGDGPRSIAIGDLDGDQIPDLAVTNFYSDDVSVLLNQASGDCNENCIPDDCDIDCGPPGGACDLSGCGLSADCNGNGVPDECERDCNGSGLLDECDIAAGNSQDCNENGLPDECDFDSGFSEDCNGNGLPDECDIDPTDPDGNNFVSNDCDGNGVPDECDPLGDCNGNVIQDICDIAAGTSNDCNENRRPDECDLDPTDPDGDGFVSDDCNGNGVPDECEPDCDGNGVPDECDLLGDCNGNGVPDECDPDCDGNGVPDECDIDPADPDGDGFVSEDCNRNGVPDECDEFFAPVVNFFPGAGPTSVAIGDLDGDQLPDMAVANSESDNVSVLLGLGDGTFAAPVYYAAGAFPHSVAIGDFNGDQMPDLAVANGGVSVLLGVGDGTFAARVDYAAGDSPGSVAIGDLNGDLVPDLAVANYGLWPEYDGHVSVLLGLGDGTFAAAVHYAAGDTTRSVAIGDLNGDLVPDLAVASYLSDSASVLLGVGDGTFGARVDYAAGDRPESVAIGDLNGDQVPDLALTNRYSNTVSVLLGVGDGTFAPYVTYAADSTPTFVAIGDLDGDQMPDLAVANETSANVSVLLGFGDGTFAARVDYALGYGYGTIAVSIGDLNGDQVLDLAAVSFYTHNLSVLLNQSWRDCNENCIPDECDMDCGPPGGACDRSGCGLSIDCNGNGVPDDCELVDNDCNGNGVPDECDLDSGLSEDCNGNGVPDECDPDCDSDGTPDECEPDGDGDGVPDDCDPCALDNPDDSDGDGVCDTDDLCPGGDDHVDNNGNGVPDACDFEPPILAPAPHNILKNRYISIDPRGGGGLNTDKDFAIRLTLTSTLVESVTAVDSQWWANAPNADCIAIVGPTRPVTPPNWDVCSTLHLTGCPIIPTSSYDIVMINGAWVSDPPLAAATQAKPGTKWHGDCVGFFDGTVWTAPNGQTSIDDAVAAIKTFQNPDRLPGCGTPPCNATHTSVTDMVPNLTPGPQINLIVNIADVFSIIQGFQGLEYPGPQIELCPDA